MVTYREALNILLNVCDGARSKDHMGFNGGDSPIAASMASFPMWTEKQQNYVIHMLHKYAMQLFDHGIDYHALTKEVTKEEKQKVFEEARKVIVQVERPILDYKDNIFSLKMPFEHKNLAKEIPKYYWNNERKVWNYNINSPGVVDGLYNLIQTHKELDFVIKSSASEQIDAYYKDKAQFDKSVKDVISIKANGVPDIPVPLKIKPFDHQKRAYLIGTTLDSAALLMEMGTGKTFSAIAIAGKRYLDGEIKKLLVIAPLSIVHVWKQEFEKHADFSNNVIVLNDSQMSKKKSKIDDGNKQNTLNVLVVSYESAWRMPDELLAWMPDMVILDESQKIKNKKTRRSEFIHELGDKVKYKLILSGTPVSQSPVDLYSQYRFLNRNIFGSNFYSFRNAYCKMGGFEHKQIVGFKNLDDLIQKAHSVAYRVTKEEALDLPEFTDEILYCQLKESAKVYKQMDKEMRVTLENGKCTAPILLAQMTRLSQIAGGFLPIIDKTGNESMQQVGTEKLELLRSVVEDFPRNKKLVIFCRFIPEINAICSMLEGMNITYCAITGDVISSTRELLIDKFQNKEDPKIIILQSAVGGLGITLTASDTMIFFSNEFSFANYEQARARVHRIGQRNHVVYIQLVAKDTVDETIISALKSKKNIADMVVDMKGGLI